MYTRNAAATKDPETAAAEEQFNLIVDLGNEKSRSHGVCGLTEKDLA